MWRTFINFFIRRFKPLDIQRSLLILGEPRSGSTWLMELINHNSQNLVVWEPFNVKHGLVSVDNQGGRLYWPPETSDTEFKRQLEAIFTHKHSNAWTLNYATSYKLLFGTRSLIKCVRGNLLLPWIVRSFDLGFKPIYMVRHPAATVLSQLQGHINIEDEMPCDATILQLYPELGSNYLNYLKTLQPGIQQGFALWCLCNKYLLEHDLCDQWIVVHYENLLLEPESELAKIEQHWNINLDIPIEKMRQASRTDFRKNLNKDITLQLTKWQNEISVDELQTLQSILDLFEIEIYSMYQALPIVH